MGMWMLLLRTACIEKEKEAWFVVNGVPIRYGLREHALISGLDCRNYPLNYMQEGSMDFVRKHFTRATIRHQDVKEKLEEMDASRDRLKMAVLYFLSSIVVGQTKTGADATPVLEFFQRAVNDLEFCKRFPWGRFSFDHMLREISHTMTHFGGTVKEGVLWPIPGFCIPMEFLAFEAISELGISFREGNPGADMSCPRMCKTRFKKSEMKGFPLEKINEKLGGTKDIDSILMARDEEKSLLARITEKDDDDDKHDVVVDSWMRRLGQGYTICFEEMYNEDVASRVRVEPEIAANASEVNTPLAELVEVVKGMGEQLKVIEDKVDGLGERVDWLADRVAPLEAYVQEQTRGETSKRVANGLPRVGLPHGRRNKSDKE